MVTIPIVIIFSLGITIGLLLAILILLALTYFKRSIETKVQVMEKLISNAGPRPKGFIVQPETESERIRNEIIEENKKQGRDTPISALR